MGKQQKLVIQKVTPGASIAVAQLNKINGAVKFGPPAKRLHFPHVRINLHERAGAQQRVESEILEPDITVLAMADVQMLDQGYGHFPPKFHHARKKIRVVEVEGSIKSNGERNRAIRVIHVQRSQVRVRQRRSELVQTQLLHIDSVKPQEVGEFQPIDGAQAVELKNTRDRIGILYLGKPCIGDLELGISFHFGNLLAQFSHITSRYS
jgi:hypothetical protein